MALPAIDGNIVYVEQVIFIYLDIHLYVEQVIFIYLDIHLDIYLFILSE